MSDHNPLRGAAWERTEDEPGPDLRTERLAALAQDKDDRPDEADLAEMEQDYLPIDCRVCGGPMDILRLVAEVRRLRAEQRETAMQRIAELGEFQVERERVLELEARLEQCVEFSGDW